MIIESVSINYEKKDTGRVQFNYDELNRLQSKNLNGQMVYYHYSDNLDSINSNHLNYTYRHHFKYEGKKIIYEERTERRSGELQFRIIKT